jgi:hypothetical protein
MRLLSTWTVQQVNGRGTIELLQGDLAQIPPEHAVDVLVVSAFQNDYRPTQTSLIGSLARRGISVADLAQHKSVDLREQFSCWLSDVIPGQFGFQQILCIESGWRGSPPELADDLFRSLAPYLLTQFPNASVAMPLIGAGDQGWPPALMMESILRAAVAWLQRGLPLRLLKIVAFSESTAELALQKFLEIRGPDLSLQSRPSEPKVSDRADGTDRYDLFLSYSHEDLPAANHVFQTLKAARPASRVFLDRTGLRAGRSWLMQIAEHLDNARRVVPLYTPYYWASNYCKDEFTAALTRQHDTGQHLLFPIYFRSAHLPYLFRNIQYLDCRESDHVKLSEACQSLVEGLHMD